MEQDDLIDNRTPAQKRGDAPRGQMVNIIRPNPPVAKKSDAASAAMRAKRNASKELALDYTQAALIAAYDIMHNSPSESSKVEAIKTILMYGLGRPQVVHVDEDGSQVVPHFTISFGEQPTEAVFQLSDEEDDETES